MEPSSFVEFGLSPATLAKFVDGNIQVQQLFGPPVRFGDEYRITSISGYGPSTLPLFALVAERRTGPERPQTLLQFDDWTIMESVVHDLKADGYHPRLIASTADDNGIFHVVLIEKWHKLVNSRIAVMKFYTSELDTLGQAIAQMHSSTPSREIVDFDAVTYGTRGAIFIPWYLTNATIDAYQH